jgi:hypothetical protein
MTGITHRNLKGPRHFKKAPSTATRDLSIVPPGGLICGQNENPERKLLGHPDLNHILLLLPGDDNKGHIVHWYMYMERPYNLDLTIPITMVNMYLFIFFIYIIYLCSGVGAAQEVL